jgi:hypothetical protein
VVTSRKTDKPLFWARRPFEIPFGMRDVDQPVVFRVHDQQRANIAHELLLMIEMLCHFSENLIRVDSSGWQICVR